MKLIEPGVVVRVTKSKAVGMVVSVDPKHDDITLVFYNRDRKKYTVVEGFTIGQLCSNYPEVPLTYDLPSFDKAWLVSGLKVGILLTTALIIFINFVR